MSFLRRGFAALLLVFPAIAQTTATSTSFGTACSSGTFLFTADRPVINTTYGVFAGVDPNGTWFQFHVDVLLSPPIDLTSLGMTGCFAYVGTANPSNLFNISGGNLLLYQLAIPNDPGLVGQTIGMQGIQFGPSSANLAGVLTTQGISMFIGDQ